MTGQSLTTRARRLYPDSRRVAAKWVQAVRYLRKNNLWVLENGTPRMIINFQREAA